uniref:Uncharacterized protein n=1 Tax=Tanacetum cinerariifolium TaxID=118510 RepID=A0A699HFC5_TANCI|nr:hypothetical protein [Tanacetum cinerariifolium]
MLDQTFDRLQKLVINTAHGVSTTSTQVNVAYFTNIDNLSDVVICAFFTSQPNSPQLAHEDLQQIYPDDMKEMDLRWQVAMLTMRARRFLKNKGRKLTVNGNETIRFDKSKVKCYNYHKKGHFARECTASRNQGNKNKESSRKSLDVETSPSKDLMSCDGLGGYDWSDQAEEGPNYALMAFSSSSSDSKKSKLMVLGYKKGLELVEEKLEFYKTNESIYLEDIKVLRVEIHICEIAIRDLRKKLEIDQKEKDEIQLNVVKFEHASKSLNKLMDYGFVNKHVVENCKAMSSKEEPKIVRKHDDVPIIKELVSDDEEKDVSQPKIEKKTVRPSIVKKEFVKSKQQEKTARKTVKQIENHRQDTHSPRAKKIRRISASSSQETHNDQFPIQRITLHQYAVCTSVHRNDGEDMFKHINIFLEVVKPIKVRGLTHDRFRLSIFPISLSGAETGDEDDPDVIDNIKTYDGYEQELNNKTQGLEEPWSNNGVPYQLYDHICEPYHFKNGKTKWTTCNSDIDGFCNGEELPGMVRVGSMTYFQDHKWYDELTNGKLKRETLALKAKIKGTWGEATPDVAKVRIARTSSNFHAGPCLIKESLVKIKQKGAILELKRRHLKMTVNCYNTPYPANKIRRISASSSQETRNDQFSIRRITVCTFVHQSKIYH